ncbi:oxidoreductase [Paractinoplanes toevensis]|uniref:Short-chain dehydrogenase/reductase n=1 Tax=Paractinoplanes toevensis TaxID=571911 RepID=A0A919W7V4_9ACTN|nr:oxidoreductase [Actinoplanes toevensis]GIM90576.1 short-chain dehydrogenase/reductase [Actinoplanes toevensis]
MSRRTVIITGASSGIGAAVARRLGAMGFTVYAAARRVGEVPPDDGIVAVKADLSDHASLDDLVGRAVDETGRVDVLVNNAGYGSMGSVEEVPTEEARRQFEVNVFGPARLTQLVVPHMRERGRGRIVNVTSVGGRIYEPLGGWYHASKFAVEGLSDCLRMELAPFGIDVVVVEPGATRTGWGPVAVAGLTATSGSGPYAEQAKALAASHEAAADKPRITSSPESVAQVVIQAIRARRPLTRYAAGTGAKPLLLARRLLPDRAFDALMAQAFGVRHKRGDHRTA